METSTPISTRREPVLIDMGDDSPVGASSDSTSLGSINSTDEKIPDSKTKAGMSNELHSMAVTPPKEMSPDTMDKRLALHCEDIASASIGNTLVDELRGEHIQTPDLSNNSFAKMIGGKVIDIQKNTAAGNDATSRIKCPQTFGMCGMKEVAPTDGKQPVSMDGMNIETPSGGSQSVAMDGMNKDQVGGVGMAVAVDSTAQGITTKPGLEENENVRSTGGRLMRTPKRKLRGQNVKPIPISRLVFGEGAKGGVLTSRACPGTSSPKRQVPMEVDSQTPPKRKRRASKIVPPADQQLITGFLGQKKADGSADANKC